MSNAIQDEFQKVVYARIQAMPDGTVISIGNGANLTKVEMLRHVETNDDIGKKMIEIEREFFQMLREGALLKQ